MVERILEDTGVAFLPGEDFGRFEEELTARLAYVDFDGKQALQASMNESGNGLLNDSFFYNNTPNVSTGIEKIRDWVKNLKQ